MCFLINFFDYIAVEMSTFVHTCSFFLAFSLLTLSINLFFVPGDAGEKFGEKMQSLFLHENPQVNKKIQF